jgi:peptidoglycan/LPS O-acetylase OafA/YrhL
MQQDADRENNFDLLRLFAALQVLFVHAIKHLKIEGLEDLLTILNLFPGVIIFFTISGFLISSSYQRAKSLRQYFINRFLRLFPALWVCFLFTIFVLIISGFLEFEEIAGFTFFCWFFSQVTFFQFWTPEFLRGWGVGTPNGSLWTIVVEIQYYLFLPILFLAWAKVKVVFKLIVFTLVSIGTVLLVTYYFDKESLVFKLIGLTIAPYLYCFLFGAIINIYWIEICGLFKNKGFIWLIIYILFCNYFKTGPSYFPQNYEFLANIFLSVFVISAAFTIPRLSNILNGYDISYGIYIYHMVIVNIFVSYDCVRNVAFLFTVALSTLLLSFLSWTLVERKFLRRKNKDYITSNVGESN